MSAVISANASDKLKALAKDLSKEPPRSPREKLAGYIIAARLLDKCRAMLNGTQGPYNYNHFMDTLFFEFTEIDPDAFSAFVATGAKDEEVADWITDHAVPRWPLDIIKWNNRLMGARISEMPDRFQLFMEDYIARHVPKHRPVYHVFDIFDLEEGRL